MRSFCAKSCSNNKLKRDIDSVWNRRALDAKSCHDIAMLHRVCILGAGAMVALSILFVFRPYQAPSRIQPPHGTLAATECVAYPDPSAIPPEYSCERP